MGQIITATLNVALLEGLIPHTTVRAPALAAAVADLEADIVALQEVWSAEHRELILESSPLPHHVAADPLPGLSEGYAVEGAIGLLLLSRWPVLTSSVLALPSTFVRRAVIVAEIDAPGGPITILATHLTADMQNLEHGDSGGWEGEHRVQVYEVLRLAAEASGPVLLMGDLNCGPDNRDGHAKFAANYQLLRSGFETNAYADDPTSPCTWCASNPLVPFETSSILDHIMESGFTPTSWQRILSEPVTLEGPDGPIRTPLSDHYGVTVTLEL